MKAAEAQPGGLGPNVQAELAEVVVEGNGRLDAQVVDDGEDHQGFPYRILSWSAPLNGSGSPSMGSAAMRSKTSTTRRRSSSGSFSSTRLAEVHTITVTSAPSGRETPGSGMTTPSWTRPRMIMKSLWPGGLGRVKLASSGGLGRGGEEIDKGMRGKGMTEEDGRGEWWNVGGMRSLWGRGLGRGMGRAARRRQVQGAVWI